MAIQLFIMDADVRWSANGLEPAPLRAKGRPEKIEPFLRALALLPGKRVARETLLHVVDSQADDGLYALKSALPDELKALIRNHRAKGYELALLDGLYLDSEDFAETARKFRGLADQPFTETSVDEARDALFELDRVLEARHINPALPIDTPHKPGPGDFSGLHRKLEDLYDVARLARNVARVTLASADKTKRHLSRLARAELNQIPEAERSDIHWHLLVGADEASGLPGPAAADYQRARAFYEEAGHDLPDLLTRLPGHDGLAEALGHRSRLSASSGVPLLKVIENLGITEASAMDLRGARMEPSDCIERTERLLYFSGVLGSKWVSERRVAAEFGDLLTRLDRSDPAGDVRFMIMNPLGRAFKKLRALRDGQIGTGCVPALAELNERHRSLQVRTFDSLPAFRIVVIDDQVVTFSSYRLEAETYRATRFGWAAPQIVLDPGAPWPLAEAFRLFFEESWELATPLEQLDISRLRNKK